MTSPECQHQWQRLPMTDFTAVYRCKDCGRAVQVSVGAMLSRTLDDLDMAFQQEHGGTVIEPDPLPIPDFPGYITSLLARGYTRNPCRDHCQDKGSEHEHMRTPDGEDLIVWADGRWSGYDLTQPARLIYPAAPKRFTLPFRDDGGVRRPAGG